MYSKLRNYFSPASVTNPKAGGIDSNILGSTRSVSSLYNYF